MQHCSRLSTTREREELVRGAEVLDNTRQWIQSRLAVLTLEEQQRQVGRKQVYNIYTSCSTSMCVYFTACLILCYIQLCAEELLAELEGEEGDSELVYHLHQINKHLSSLALTTESNALQSPPMQSRLLMLKFTLIV